MRGISADARSRATGRESIHSEMSASSQATEFSLSRLRFGNLPASSRRYMVMRESPVACITCLIRRNFMGFVLTEVPSYALGMRSPLTLDSTIIRRICGKVIPSIGVVWGGNSTQFDCESSQKCRVSARRGRKPGIDFSLRPVSAHAVLARMNVS
jgi:hypothetical protein